MAGRGKKTRTETSAGTSKDYMDGSETGSIKAGEVGIRSGLSAIETSDCAEAVDDLDCETGEDQNQVKRRNDKERHPGNRPTFAGI